MNQRAIKLVIQIPCFNEESTLPITLASLPRSLESVDRVEWLVIDDGSTDRTSEVARAHGVDHVVRLARNGGLARAFMAGIRASLAAGADIIVNLDADNQYQASSLPALIAPILNGRAEMVVGERPVREIPEFSTFKKSLQRLGSAVVRLASSLNVKDAPSGFRAFSRQAAMQLNVFNEHTYTLETLIQAGQKGMAVASVPVGVNPKLRESRLIRSPAQYVWRSAITIIRIFMTYRPFRFFAIPGFVAIGLGVAVGVRFLWLYFGGNGTGHIQSLILSSILVGGGGLLLVTGLLADLISVNRKLLEKLDYRMQCLERRAEEERIV